MKYMLLDIDVLGVAIVVLTLRPQMYIGAFTYIPINCIFSSLVLKCAVPPKILFS